MYFDAYEEEKRKCEYLRSLLKEARKVLVRVTPQSKREGLTEFMVVLKEVSCQGP